MITSPKYSFIQFGSSADACCQGINDVTLPVFAGTDLQFQVVSDSSISSVDVVNENGDVISTNSGFTSLGNNIYAFTGTIDITGLACEQCFQLKISTALSNIFKKVCDDCYTSLLEYYNDEDYAGFLYCNVAFTNKVRLPFYLRKPKMNEDRTVYRKSDGTIRLTKSLITKQYILTTDYLTEQMHDCLAVAFGHDNTNVYNSIYSGGISKSGDYAPDWQDGICVAPLDLAVDVTPIAIKNSNCQDCPDVTVCVAPSVPSFSLPDAAVSNPYNQSITLGGTAPFTLSGITKPAWMTVSVSGSHVTFTGTPGTGSDGTGITVAFTASNACGTANGSTTMNVVVVSCNPVAIVGSPAFPNGYVGEYYAYSFYLTGDADFSLGTSTKPAWMNVTFDQSAKKVTINGTPTATLTAQSVSLQITNCSGGNNTTLTTNITVNPSGVHFIDITVISSDALTEHEQGNLFGGAPGATVTIVCTYLTNTNGGTVTLNGSLFSVGATFNITLDGSGNGNFLCNIDGVSNPSTAILARFSIQSVSAGAISTPIGYQNSKSF
ncbi:MAG: hypothetical protein ABI237_06020 [Ginsengibacter sp.]